jgi:DNA-binding CsgD family transcriptional regulator
MGETTETDVYLGTSKRRMVLVGLDMRSDSQNDPRSEKEDLRCENRGFKAKQPAQDLLLLTANQHAVNKLSVGVIILDARANVIVLNPEARLIVNERDGIGMTERRLILNRKCEFSSVLQASLTEGGAGTDAAIHVTRPSGKRSYECVISPIRGLTGLSRQRAYTMVFVIDPERIQISHERFARRYRLTPNEARLAAIMAEGQSIRRASERMSIGRSTARSHLKHLMQKVGVRRQAELVAVLLRTPPVRDPKYSVIPQC